MRAAFRPAAAPVGRLCPVAGRPPRAPRAARRPPVAAALPNDAFVAAPHRPMLPVPLQPDGTGRAMWEGSVPPYYRAPRPTLPLLLQVAPAAAAWDAAALAAPTRAAIEAHLAGAGAIVFRGLPLAGAAQLKAFFGAVGYREMPYLGQVIKRRTVDGVDEALTDPPTNLLYPHAEVTDLPRSAAKITFFCLQPATAGGHSTLASAAAVTESIGADIVARFAARGGVRNCRWYPSQAQYDALPDTYYKRRAKTWNAFTETDDRAQAAAYFTREGLDVHWDAEGGLRTRSILPACVADERTGAPLWHNVVHAAPGFEPLTQITYGDGSPIEPEVVMRVRTARWQHTVAYPLERGDWLVVDNRRCLHGRTPYEDGAGDPERRVLVIMAHD